jgi:hypothetical protein
VNYSLIADYTISVAARFRQCYTFGHESFAAAVSAMVGDVPADSVRAADGHVQCAGRNACATEYASGGGERYAATNRIGDGDHNAYRNSHGN